MGIIPLSPLSVNAISWVCQLNANFPAERGLSVPFFSLLNVTKKGFPPSPSSKKRTTPPLSKNMSLRLDKIEGPSFPLLKKFCKKPLAAVEGGVFFSSGEAWSDRCPPSLWFIEGVDKYLLVVVERDIVYALDTISFAERLDNRSSLHAFPI